MIHGEGNRMADEMGRRTKVRLVSKRINYLNLEICDKLISCAVINLSLGGVMVKLPYDMTSLPIEIGTVVVFKNTPEKYKNLLEGKSATVAWYQNAMCGIAFAAELPLTNEQLQELLNS